MRTLKACADTHGLVWNACDGSHVKLPKHPCLQPDTMAKLLFEYRHLAPVYIFDTCFSTSLTHVFAWLQRGPDAFWRVQGTTVFYFCRK
jgi:hypothetical protein